VVGHARVMLNFLYFNLVLKDTFAIISYTGEIVGQVQFSLKPIWRTAAQRKAARTADSIMDIPDIHNGLDLELRVGMVRSLLSLSLLLLLLSFQLFLFFICSLLHLLSLPSLTSLFVHLSAFQGPRPSRVARHRHARRRRLSRSGQLDSSPRGPRGGGPGGSITRER
jgi:hypothetical protein